MILYGGGLAAVNYHLTRCCGCLLLSFLFFFSCSSKEIWDPGHVKHYFADFKSFCNIVVNSNARLMPVNSIFNLDFVSVMDTVISKYLRVLW